MFNLVSPLQKGLAGGHWGVGLGSRFGRFPGRLHRRSKAPAGLPALAAANTAVDSHIAATALVETGFCLFRKTWKITLAFVRMMVDKSGESTPISLRRLAAAKENRNGKKKQQKQQKHNLLPPAASFRKKWTCVSRTGQKRIPRSRRSDGTPSRPTRRTETWRTPQWPVDGEFPVKGRPDFFCFLLGQLEPPAFGVASIHGET